MAHHDTTVAVCPCGMTNCKQAARYLHRLKPILRRFQGLRLPAIPSMHPVCKIIIRETVYAVFDGCFPCGGFSYPWQGVRFPYM